MAEEEKIREHAKQAMEALTNKKKKWKERLRDFLWEILIIVVAINLTLWFHNWSDKRHDRELEKDFLIGTRSDLSNIKNNLNWSFTYYQPTLDYYDSVWVQINEHRIDKAFVDTNSYNLVNTLNFLYDNSRFDNFKSSGYLRLIENDSLSMNITYLYTIFLPMQVEADNVVFNERRQDYLTYIGLKAQTDASGRVIVSNLLNVPEVKFLINWQREALNERKSHKQQTVQVIDTLMTQIDRELKTRFKYEVKKYEK